MRNLLDLHSQRQWARFVRLSSFWQLASLFGTRMIDGILELRILQRADRRHRIANFNI